MLNQSSWFVDVIRGHTLKVSFTINGYEHHMGYYLANDIYPSCPLFIKVVHVPQ
jgi:hypothetical protein